MVRGEVVYCVGVKMDGSYARRNEEVKEIRNMCRTGRRVCRRVRRNEAIASGCEDVIKEATSGIGQSTPP
jgi:hypothetical protein